MFPITLDTSCVSIALVGNGKEAYNRLKKLDEAGAAHVIVYADTQEKALETLAGKRLRKCLPTKEDLAQVQMVMIAGLAPKKAAELATLTREAGRLVNVEDDIPWCDFHFPSVVRRGDLLFAISTKGKSPTLARRLKEWLGQTFSNEWAEHLEDIGEKRDTWRQQGLSFHEVMHKSEAYIESKGWLANLCSNIKK